MQVDLEADVTESGGKVLEAGCFHYVMRKDRLGRL